MANGLYLFQGRIPSLGEREVKGVNKKINSQVKVFSENLCQFDLIGLVPKFKSRSLKFFFSCFLGNGFNYDDIKSRKYDYVYIRRLAPCSASVITVLKAIKNANNDAKIVIELPTYPYDKEYVGFIGKVSLFVDYIYNKKLKYYVDRIAILTDDQEVFGIPTIRFYNGVDVASIPVVKNEFLGNEINLIAVAQFAAWHGYERVIDGLVQYYKNGGNRKIILHMVGGGPVLGYYKELVKEKKLYNYVKFYGSLCGEELTKVFEKCDLGICSLGGHRKNIFLSSELKSREYLARGLPMISASKIDIFSNDFEFCYYVPADDSVINIEEIIKFRDRVYSGRTRQEVVTEIRKFAEENCDMKKTMNNIIQWFKKGNI